MKGRHCTTASRRTTQERAEPACGERRAHGERRRNAGGLFEVRARREGVSGDRRRQRYLGATARRRLRGLWQLVKAH